MKPACAQTSVAGRFFEIVIRGVCLSRAPRSDPAPPGFSEPGIPRGWNVGGGEGGREGGRTSWCAPERTYNSSMTTRNKRCIQLVSLDDHKTLTPLIASKLRVSRVTTRYRSRQVPGFLSPSIPGSLPLFAPRIARRNGRRDNHRDIASGRVAGEPEGKGRVPSYFHPTSSLAALRLRDLVLRQFPRGSFGVLRTLLLVEVVLYLGDCYHFSIAIRAPCSVS